MTRLREVPISRESKRRDLLLRDKLLFLDLQLVDFRIQRRSGNSEFRCRTFWASDFSLAFSQCGGVWTGRFEQQPHLLSSICLELRAARVPASF